MIRCAPDERRQIPDDKPAEDANSGRRMTPGQKAALTRKRRATAKKATRTPKRRATAKKATRTPKRTAAGKKAAPTRKRRAAGRKAAPAQSQSPVHSALARLEGKVASGRIGRAQPWAGADIEITDIKPPLSDQPGVFPQKDYVATRFVAELSWLFESLRDVFGSSIDSQSEHPFYGRLAAAADRYAASKSPESQTAGELLTAVLKEARQMTGEFA
jgi:hypothetical protein